LIDFDLTELTFIILDRSRPDSPNISTKGGAMVGDVNLFFNDYEDEHAAEIEIMIADSESRGKGLGPEAVRLMMAYGVHRLNVSQYIVKIGASNQKSINMFKTLGFDQFEYLEWCDEQHGKYVIDRSADLNTTFPLQERQLGDVL
jgi:RimJ/RimL family protein N-acetyltransferase